MDCLHGCLGIQGVKDGFNKEDIGPAIARALACGRAAVVQIPIDPEISALEVPAFEEFATWYGDKGYE